ncbi:MAG: BON domain-containing protein [Deltaproteobacteria bacterium]|nr:BON domain-containing protein [Deltaproteobacteria bacterium]
MRKKPKAKKIFQTVIPFLLGLAILSWGNGAGAADPGPPSDRAISHAVDDELTDDPATPAWRIDVSTKAGVVTLTGRVYHILEKERAGKLAATLKGVRRVDNRIEVVPRNRKDAEILADVEEAFLVDAVAESWEITPSVTDQVVTLTGEVTTRQEKKVAERVAKGVKGVKAVNNQLTVGDSAERSDTRHSIRDCAGPSARCACG